MKKLAVFVLIIALVAIAAGCGKKSEESSSSAEFVAEKEKAKSGEILDMRFVEDKQNSSFYEKFVKERLKDVDDEGNKKTEITIGGNTLILNKGDTSLIEGNIFIKDGMTGDIRALLEADEKDTYDESVYYWFEFVVDDNRFVFSSSNNYYIYDLTVDKAFPLMFGDSDLTGLSLSEGYIYGFDSNSNQNGRQDYSLQSGRYFAIDLSDYSYVEKKFNLEIRGKSDVVYPYFSPDYKKIILHNFVSESTATPATVNIYVLDVESGKIIDNKEVVFDTEYTVDGEKEKFCQAIWITNTQFWVECGHKDGKSPVYEFDLAE